MQLSLDHRLVGDATVVTCRGRLTMGDESAALQQSLDALIPRTRHVVLHLGAVEFIDSGGLGLLVRYLARAQRSTATLSVCAVSPKIDEVLRITKLKTVFPPYETEALAITEVHRRDTTHDDVAKTTVLCVDGSSNVTAYIRELLKAAGYRALTALNLPDALVLLVATRPAVVVVSAELNGVRGTRAAEEFHRLAAERSLVLLPAGFSAQDAGHAAAEVLSAVRAAASV
jgi:anti-sigma B factor antagonist